jgi:hypothetical protein
MQGFTLPAGKVDLNLTGKADPVTAYVALSRFKRADDVLILQAFDLRTFQEGVADQPALLLKYIGLEDKADIHEDLKSYETRVSDMHATRRLEIKENRQATICAIQVAMTPEAKQRKHTPHSEEAKQRKHTPHSEEAKQRKHTRVLKKWGCENAAGAWNELSIHCGSGVKRQRMGGASLSGQCVSIVRIARVNIGHRELIQ